MTDKQLVLDTVHKLPDDTPLEKISDGIEFLVAVQQISPSRFQVRDVRQPFLFEWNIGELLELRARQAVFFKRNQIHCSFL